MDSKFPEQSKTIQTDFVLPADTNSLNNLFGGELLARMDKVASIAAIKHSEQIVVNSSMEVFIDVWKQNKTDRKKVKVNEAIYTFVAVNKRGKPVKVPLITPQTDLEKTRYDAALRRRQLSLVLAGKMSPSEATELKAIFD